MKRELGGETETYKAKIYSRKRKNKKAMRNGNRNTLCL